MMAWFIASEQCKLGKIKSVKSVFLIYMLRLSWILKEKIIIIVRIEHIFDSQL